MNICTDIWNLICEFADYRSTIALSRSNSEFHSILKSKVINYLPDIPTCSTLPEGKELYKSNEKLITFRNGNYHVYKITIGEVIEDKIVLTAKAKVNQLYVSYLQFTTNSTCFLINESEDVKLQIKSLSYYRYPTNKKTSNYFTVGFGYLTSNKHKEISVNLDRYYRILIDNIYSDIYIHAKKGKKFDILKDKLSEKEIQLLAANININSLSDNIRIISKIKDYNYDLVMIRDIDNTLYNKLHKSSYHPDIVCDLTYNIQLYSPTTAFVYRGTHLTGIYYKSVDFDICYPNFNVLLGFIILLANQNNQFKPCYLLCPACKVDISMKDKTFLESMIESCDKAGGYWNYMSKFIREHISTI